ncbi:MAG: hypothetical protein GEU95_23670 [Rhizobiales bacterium]|nr:hypothetical protein [Hyphomicrobiales bacterium]
MRVTPRAGVAAFALVCSIAFVASGATAQTPNPGSAANQINPSPNQASALVKELANFVSQSVTGFKPSVGATVPKELKTQPMPPAAKAALPEAQDHHVAKLDDQTILIVDPDTGQVVGMITGSDDGGTTGQGSPGGAPGTPSAPGTGPGTPGSGSK